AVGAAGGFDSLLGVEGAAARLYFAAFPQLLRNSDPAFRFAGRTRRPPADPVNAMLSFAYAMLLRHWLAALAAAGFDPYLGFFHRPLAGRAGLALDMMEPFRPLVADSAVVGAINNGEIRGDDFDRDGGAVLLNANGRKALIAAFERRMDILLTDPADEREKSYRRLFADQSRRLAQFLEEKRSDFPHYIPR
ncbi:MAG TPA: CRISPR-associated endonuclease Cas1, partial [Azospirillaceae bacterium]|nr:CRISPR-associated endonuclease Cas1 [Azospirillaceae bacterium]